MTPNGINNQTLFFLTSLRVFLTNLDYFQFQRGGLELIAYSNPGHPVMTIGHLMAQLISSALESARRLF